MTGSVIAHSTHDVDMQARVGGIRRRLPACNIHDIKIQLGAVGREVGQPFTRITRVPVPRVGVGRILSASAV